MSTDDITAGEENYAVKQIIILRVDVPMSIGKMVGQGCHASSRAGDITNNGFLTDYFDLVPEYPNQERIIEKSERMNWLIHRMKQDNVAKQWKMWRYYWDHHLYKKIVLYVTNEEELIAIARVGVFHNLPCFLVQDAGMTEIPAGTVTACAIGPANAEYIDPICGTLPLLADRNDVIPIGLQTWVCTSKKARKNLRSILQDIVQFLDADPSIEQIEECIKQNLQRIEDTSDHFSFKSQIPPDVPQCTDAPAIAMKYIFTLLGLNLRPEKIEEESNEDRSVFRLNATVPHDQLESPFNEQIPVNETEAISIHNVGKLVVSEKTHQVSCATNSNKIEENINNGIQQLADTQQTEITLDAEK